MSALRWRTYKTKVVPRRGCNLATALDPLLCVCVGPWLLNGSLTSIPALETVGRTFRFPLLPERISARNSNCAEDGCRLKSPLNSFLPQFAQIIALLRGDHRGQNLTDLRVAFLNRCCLCSGQTCSCWMVCVDQHKTECVCYPALVCNNRVKQFKHPD